MSHSILGSSPPRAVTATSRRGADARVLRPQGYLWVLPALIVSVGLLYYSIGYTGYISTLDWDGSSPQPVSVGFENYVQLVSDPVFWGALAHTLIFFVATFIIQSVLGLLFASILHSNVRFGGIYKVLIFAPVVIAPAFMAPVFRQIFAADGAINWLLGHLGLGFLKHSWLADSATALPVVILIAVWGATGVNFILYFAALGQLDPQLLEAARIDGAGSVRIFFSVILPSVRGTTLALAILTAIGALKTFDIPYLVTSAGPNHATEFLGTYIYTQSIPLAHVGYGAALSIMLLFIAIAMALVLNTQRKRTED